MINKNHIIHKVFFEVHTPDTNTAYYLKDHLDVFLKQSLLPTLRMYFDSLTQTENEIVRFDTVELNINSKNVKDQVQLQLDIIKSIQKQIIEKKASNQSNTIDSSFSITSKENSDQDTFLHFLKTGQNPWWNATTEQKIFDQEFIKNLVSSKNFIPKLKIVLQKKIIRKRLVYQFSDEVLITMFSEKKFSEKDTRLLKKHLKTNEVRERFWEIIIKYVADDNQRSLTAKISDLIIDIIEERYKKRIRSRLISTKFLTEKFSEISSKALLNDPEIENIKSLIIEEFTLGGKPNNAIDRIVHRLHKGVDQKKNYRDLKGWVRELVTQIFKGCENEIKNIQKDILSVTSAILNKELEISSIHNFEYSKIKIEEHRELVDSAAVTLAIEEIEEEKIEIEEVYIKNAGLVLLHPFLSRFFITTKLADDTGRIKPDKIQLAIHLLHYIATKKEQQSESNMIFEKFLCGFPIDKPIQKTIRLPQRLKKEGEKLLEAILKNWEVLKNTTPDGLREGFIQREGKIILNDDSKYRIIVERKTQDILLEKLPWNLTIVKLPWMDKLIFVEW